VRNKRKQAAGERRKPRKATPAYLRNWALHYLERYASSSAHLRRLMLVKVARSAAAHGTDAASGRDEVDKLIRSLEATGLLDDGAYAGAKAQALHRRAQSARAIRSALAAKGIAADLIAEALEVLGEEAEAPELSAALAYARKRRLGPYRAAGARSDAREKDLAALGRRGFDYDLARRVIDAQDPRQLEAEAD